MTDLIMSTVGVGQQQADRPADKRFEGLHASRGFHRAEGDVDRHRHVQKVSLYSVVRRHPLTSLVASAALLAVEGAVAAAERNRAWTGLANGNGRRSSRSGGRIAVGISSASSRT